MPTVAGFEMAHSGQLVKSPHGISGQCVSVPSEFAVENGWPELFGPGDGTAEAIWQNGIAGYQKIVNIAGPAGNYPGPGDFVFFSYNHVVLVESATINGFVAFEQNDPLGSPAHRKAYNYNGVQGWFHHESLAPVAQPTGGGTFTVRATANVRTGPHVTAPIITEIHPGSIVVEGFVNGDVGTVAGKTSNQWGITQNGHYFNRAALA